LAQTDVRQNGADYNRGLRKWKGLVAFIEGRIATAVLCLPVVRRRASS
jgi:hypothetical protein